MAGVGFPSLVWWVDHELNVDLWGRSLNGHLALVQTLVLTPHITNTQNRRPVLEHESGIIFVDEDRGVADP